MAFKLAICLLICLIGIVSATNTVTSATNYVSSYIPDIYSTTILAKCPLALHTIKTEIIKAVNKEKRMGASLLRLHFHDCFVQGCDASVLLKDTPKFKGEQGAIPNLNSVRGYDVIENIKAKLEALCPYTISCADIIAVAARDSVVAVSMLGGPSWAVKLGRKDSTTASFDGTFDLPAPFHDLKNLTVSFQKKGFSVDEMVALSGAHTIGLSKCFLFRSRIYNETNVDPSYRKLLQATCPEKGGDTNSSPFDQTPNSFDNVYYKSLVYNKGLLHSDQQLYIKGGFTNHKVLTYADNPQLFALDFAKAMRKIGNLSPPTGNQGQIRKVCSRVN